MTELLAHEWLAPIGGSENVFEALIDAFPQAARLCLWNDAPERFGAVPETYLARTPLRRSKAAALPFMRSAWSRVPLGEASTVIASSHAMAHHVAGRAVREGRRGFAYVHSPARYLWAPEHDDRGQSRAVGLVAPSMRKVDLRGVDERVRYAANSRFVRERIADAWHVDSDVIYPNVDVARYRDASDADELSATDNAILESLPASYVLGASRLVEYKRLDVAMDVGEALSLPVVICGSGPDQERLELRAQGLDVPVLFLGRVSDEILPHLFRRAELLVFMAIEDFGIMPVEAIAAGTPVLVNSTGGAAEIIERTGGGRIADPADLSATLVAAREAMDSNMTTAVELSEQFGATRFGEEVRRWVGDGS